MDSSSRLKRLHYADHLPVLQKACDWMNVDMGRAVQYKELIRQFFEHDVRSPEHILAYNESCEIRDIYDLWKDRIKDFPGLEERIRRAFSKGPVTREGERPGRSTNRARNDAFVYLLAGKLMRAGINVMAVDGIVARDIICHKDADITFDWEGSVIDVQCKRPQAQNALHKRMKEARRQLTKPIRRGRMGIIAIDCSSLIRPPNNILEVDSVELADQVVSERLEALIPEAIRHFDNKIAGAFLFARVPTETRIEKSPILSLNGKSFEYIRPDSVSILLLSDNPALPSSKSLFKAISERISESYEIPEIA